MENNHNNRLEESRRRVNEKIARSNQVVGFVDDYADDNIRSFSAATSQNRNIIYKNPIEDDKKPKRKVTKMSRKRYRRQNNAVIALVLFFVLVAGGCIALLIAGKKSKAPQPDAGDTVQSLTEDTKRADGTTDKPSDASSKTDESTAGKDKNEKASNSITPSEAGESGILKISNDEIYKGNLILVNYKYEYVFPEENILVSMKERDDYFSVSTLDTVLQKEALDSFYDLTKDLYDNSGCDDVLVVSSFRSVEKQEEIYQDRLERFGSEYAASYVATPGYSEHHTGLAMDLSVYTDDGVSYDIETYEGCTWFNYNYDKYGYILRYPEHKAAITSINYEGWHYRFVGLPHSLIMDKLDLCLEEYIETYLKDFRYDTSILCYDKNTGELRNTDSASLSLGANEYAIYYVPASDGDTTDIPIPKDMKYTVSGNNIDGFIVTLG